MYIYVHIYIYLFDTSAATPTNETRHTHAQSCHSYRPCHTYTHEWATSHIWLTSRTWLMSRIHPRMRHVRMSAVMSHMDTWAQSCHTYTNGPSHVTHTQMGQVIWHINSRMWTHTLTNWPSQNDPSHVTRTRVCMCHTHTKSCYIHVTHTRSYVTYTATNEPRHTYESNSHVTHVNNLYHIFFFDGYCSTVQGLLDWFEVDLLIQKKVWIIYITYWNWSCHTHKWDATHTRTTCTMDPYVSHERVMSCIWMKRSHSDMHEPCHDICMSHT